ncbi:MAG TPA: helix-hairpin-helix domain-containing protein [Pirellulales bacterium]|jgi:competence protein ComEA
MAPQRQPDPPRARWLLRRADQAAVAGLLLLALVSMAGWWLAHGGARGNLIELERMPQREAQFQVDLNEADWPELSQLPGVGETLAQRIVESRQTEGPFVDNEELQRVRGIGPRTYERIKPYLRPTPGTGNVAGR